MTKTKYGIFYRMNDIKISVIIATRNRAASLARLLEGLAAQVDAPPFEVIIGDNGSIDDTPSVIEHAGSKLTVCCVREEHPGKSRALNAALRIAGGAIFVFTDDDVQPHPQWLARIFEASLMYPECNVFGGRILVDLKNVPGWVRRSFNLMGLLTSRHGKGKSDARYGFNEYPFGPNMAVRRHCIAQFNSPYPEHLGPGTRMPVGDEPTFLSQFSPPDATDRMFVASACVMHDVEAENVIFYKALERCYRAGRAHGMLGISNVPPDMVGHVSTLTLIGKRLIACRSLRELACVSARYLGYLQGNRELPINSPVKSYQSQRS